MYEHDVPTKIKQKKITKTLHIHRHSYVVFSIDLKSLAILLTRDLYISLSVFLMGQAHVSGVEGE